MALHREENSSATAVCEVQMKRNPRKSIEIGPEKSQQEGLIWPLRVGREIWGADVAFTSIRRRRENVEGGISAISQLIGVILYGFQTIGTPRGVPKACKLYAASSEPMKKNSRTHTTRSVLPDRVDVFQPKSSPKTHPFQQKPAQNFNCKKICNIILLPCQSRLIRTIFISSK